MTTPARFDVRQAVQDGMALARAAPVATWLGGWLVSAQGSAGSSSRTPRVTGGEGPLRPVAEGIAAALAWAAPLGACLELVLFLVRCLVVPGWLRLVRAGLDGEPPAIGRLASGGDRFAAMVGWRLLRFVVVAACGIGAALPGAVAVVLAGASGLGDAIVVGTGVVAVAVPAAVAWLVARAALQLGDALVALEGAGPLAALQGSVARTRPVLGAAVGFVVAEVALGVAAVVVGVLACCVGVIVTVPLWVAVVDCGRVRALDG